MNKEELIKFLKKEISMYENLIEQRKRNIKNIKNRDDIWLYNYQEELNNLKSELKKLEEESLI